jgi:DnaJ-class molecular chaperone
LEELRRQYKELLKKYHPDNANGNTQEINAEYDVLFKRLKDRHESKSTNGRASGQQKEKSRFDNMK